MTMHRVRAKVSAQALRHNYALLSALAPQARLWPVIKADAYGHGATIVARALADAEGLCVAAMSEAIQLREAGETRPLLLLGGVQGEQQWRYCIDQSIDVVLHNASHWRLLLQQSRAPRYWLKFDTGMGRLGFWPGEGRRMAAELDGDKRQKMLGLMTHLACADDPQNPKTLQQLEIFGSVRAVFPEAEVSIANSAGLVAWPQARLGLIRPGLAIYGIDPMLSDALTGLDLQPALRLEAQILDLKRIPAGATVGYGADWRCRQATMIAIVAAGYADGIPRSLASTPFTLTGPGSVALAMRGRVSMDMVAVEIPEGSDYYCGQWLGLWGAGALPVSRVAAWAGTISYELLTNTGGRVGHQLIDSHPLD